MGLVRDEILTIKKGCSVFGGFRGYDAPIFCGFHVAGSADTPTVRWWGDIPTRRRGTNKAHTPSGTVSEAGFSLDTPVCIPLPGWFYSIVVWRIRLFITNILLTKNLPNAQF